MIDLFRLNVNLSVIVYAFSCVPLAIIMLSILVTRFLGLPNRHSRSCLATREEFLHFVLSNNCLDCLPNLKKVVGPLELGKSAIHIHKYIDIVLKILSDELLIDTCIFLEPKQAEKFNSYANLTVQCHHTAVSGEVSIETFLLEHRLESSI